MTWYSAHIVMLVEFKEGPQQRYPVWENIVLVAANTEAEAFAKAEAHGRADEGDDDGSFRWGKIPARWVFAGVRKLTECVFASDCPNDGTEVSYSELELDSREAVEKMVAGKRVQVWYDDRYRPAQSRQTKAIAAVKRPKRRRA